MKHSRAFLRSWQPPEVRLIDREEYELIPGNPEHGFTSKAAAQKLAFEWKVYPAWGKARIVKARGKYWVYGM